MPICSFIICLTLIALNFKAQNYFVYQYDTINKIDPIGKKQGKWIVFGQTKPGTCYKEEQKLEEGIYRNNRKTGVWIEYYCNGNMKNKLTFVDGRPDGEAIIYHENGKVSETGTWKTNRWSGTYKTYDNLGTLLCDFIFDTKGKRQPGSWQINEKEYGDRFHISWFHKLTAADSLPDTLNGFYSLYNKNKRISKEGFFFENKLIKGRIYIYDEDGILKSIRIYEHGIFMADGLLHGNNDGNLLPYTDDKVNDKLILNGKHTLYNKNKQITKDGEFHENRFMNGKAYFYNEKQELTRVAVYKNGIYVGDTSIEK